MRAVTACICCCDASPSLHGAFSRPSPVVIDSISGPRRPSLHAWGCTGGWGDEFKLFHLNLCPPTKTDCLRSSKKLVPALRSNRSSAGENKWRSKSLVMFHFYRPLPRSSPTLFQKYHRARSCRKQCLINKRAPASISRRQCTRDTAGLVTG